MHLEAFCCVCSCISLLCVKFLVSVSRYMLLWNLAFVILECSKFIHVGRLQNNQNVVGIVTHTVWMAWGSILGGGEIFCTCTHQL
jgi:hypothetical protein